MVKTILFILTFFCVFTIQAQYDWTPAKIILKDGTSFRGLVKLPIDSGGLVSIGSTKFKYKKNKKAPNEKLGKETVEEVIFDVEGIATSHYKYVPINYNKYALLEQVVNGKVSLYSRIVSKNEKSINFDPNIKSSGNYYTQFYFLRKNENKAILINYTNSYKVFVINAIKYFSDCSLIVDYLDNGLYDLNNLIELVEDYNLLCE